jgi:hypothetical protein
MDFKKWFGEHGSFLKGSEVLMQSSNSSSIISIPASQPKFIFHTMQKHAKCLEAKIHRTEFVFAIT